MLEGATEPAGTTAQAALLLAPPPGSDDALIDGVEEAIAHEPVAFARLLAPFRPGAPPLGQMYDRFRR